jgi:hypothetical protein
MIYLIDSMLFIKFLEAAPPPTLDRMTLDSTLPEFQDLDPLWQILIAAHLKTPEGREVWAAGQAMRAGRQPSFSKTYADGAGMCCARVRAEQCGFCDGPIVKTLERCEPLVKSL